MKELPDPKKWYWYACRSDELMIDLDSGTLLEIALKRITFPDYPIKVKNLFIAPSFHEGHCHMIVQLCDPLSEMRRMIYQLYLMDHVYRSVKNLIRSLENKRAASLLISPHNFQCSGVALNAGKFWRAPDALCHCTIQRHKSQTAILKCPAHLKLRGE